MLHLPLSVMDQSYRRALFNKTVGLIKKEKRETHHRKKCTEKKQKQRLKERQKRKKDRKKATAKQKGKTYIFVCYSVFWDLVDSMYSMKTPVNSATQCYSSFKLCSKWYIFLFYSLLHSATTTAGGCNRAETYLTQACKNYLHCLPLTFVNRLELVPWTCSMWVDNKTQ